VRVVRLRLDAPLPPGAADALSADERERAARFVRDVHRRRFVAARAGLRRALGSCLGCQPAQVGFSYSDRGRPGLLAPPDFPLDFNLAHSGELGLLALSQRRLGVDVEELRPLRDGMQLARRFFSPREVEALAALPEELRTRGFFHAWTRKEALMKATGAGIAALGQVEVHLTPGEPPAVLAAPGGAGAWQLLHLEPAAGYVGALALQRTDEVPRLHTWSWPVAGGDEG
jgi:4'-phosphopantetheinyl transferase